MDTMAIKSGEVPAMQSAIESYIVEVETCLNNIKSYEMGSGEGIYGSAQVATVNNYISETCTQINSIVRYFDEFKSKLTEVAAAYADQQAAITTGDVATAKQNDSDLVTVNRMS